MGYLVCDKCGGYYKLQKSENPNDFNDKCDCGGHLKYSTKPTITTETDKKEAKTKLKELTGGFFLSTEYCHKLKENNLDNQTGNSIKENLKHEIESGKLRAINVESRLDTLIKNEDEREKARINWLRSEQERIWEKNGTIEKLEEKKEKQKQKCDKYRGLIRRGVHCKVLKPVVGAESFGGLVKGAATLAFGITGWALTSGVSTKAETIEVDATIKVVPNGVVILSDQEETLRIPFEQIIYANTDWRNVIIKVVGDKKVTAKDCDHYNEVAGLILESACGKEEEGWV